MDWADDVAYSVHDVEDGVASGRIDLRALRSAPEVDAVVAVAAELYAADLEAAELAAAHDRLLASGSIPTSYDGSRADLAALKDMTSRLIGHLLGGGGGRHPRPARRRSADPLPRRPGDPLRHPRRVRGPQGRRRPLRDVRPRAAAGDVRPARGGRASWCRPCSTSRTSGSTRSTAPTSSGQPDDAAALRAVIDQVASWTDARALLLHRQWC